VEYIFMEKNASNNLAAVKIWDIIVIGGGPAGMMAAGRAAEIAREQKESGKISRDVSILLLEKNSTLGKKLLITGGGRCNVTNAEFDNRALLAKFKDSDKFLFSAFSQHSVKETLEFFHDHGMPTKVEAEKRVFPESNTAQSVWDVLVKQLQTRNITVRSNAAVSGFIQTKPAQIAAVKLADGEIIHGRNFILAPGGTSHPETGSTGDGYAWLAKIGHKVGQPQAALVPVEVKDSWVKQLSGFSLPTAKITLFQGLAKDGTPVKVPGKNAVKKGKVLFTHFGLSGPAILNMSSEIGELLKYGEVILSLDLLPSLAYDTLNETLQKLFKKESNKMFKNSLSVAPYPLIPAPLVPAVLEKSGIDGDTFCHSITREERLHLVKVLKDMRITPTGLLGSDKAIVASGGVALEEIDWKTMRSRLVPNLHIIGDMLDINRPSGGYSLQLCWTTGWVAGTTAGTEIAGAVKTKE